MERCVFCGATLNQNTSVCPTCGRTQLAEAVTAASGPQSRHCPQCGEPVLLEYRFCIRCADPLQASCPACGQENSIWADFCAHCAHPFHPMGVQASSPSAHEDRTLPFVQEKAAPELLADASRSPAVPHDGLPGESGASRGSPGRPPTGLGPHNRLLCNRLAKVIAVSLIITVVLAGGVVAMIEAGNHSPSVTTHRPAAPPPTLNITEFPIPTGKNIPGEITAGLDRNLWFTLDCHYGDLACVSQIGRITPEGQITEFPIPTAKSAPGDITAGPDGNLWFTDHGTNEIGRITPEGQITEFPIPTAISAPDRLPKSGPAGITAGTDGNLWFTDFNTAYDALIGRITPEGQITEFPLALSIYPEGITSGPDDALWFTAGSAGIGRITPDGQITVFHPPLSNKAELSPFAITAGPDGNLWFTDCDSSGDQCTTNLGRITPEGQVTEFPLTSPAGIPLGITAGPDGNLWFTEPIGTIGRITPGGQITEFPLPTAGSGPHGIEPQGITIGPDGNLWFTEAGSNQIGRIVPDK